MMQKLYIIIFCIILVGCNHPESKKYERNQGYKLYDSSKDKLNVNVIESEAQSDSIQGNRNVLKMKLQNGVRYVWID